MGSWASHVGYEVVDAPANRNYSMSYMFSWGPFFHTGIKAEATAGKSGFMLGIANPTDYKFAPSGSKKSLLAQYSLAVTDNIKVYLNYVGGERPTDSLKYSQFDVVLTAKATDKFSVVFNGTFQKTKSEKPVAFSLKTTAEEWWGSAVYLNYDPSEKIGFTLRSEYFSDKGQITAMSLAPEGAAIFANTFSMNLKAGPLTFIPEVRYETAGADVFYDKEGAGVSSNFSALFAAIYKF
jgi:Putative beta-barrel porin-2, OmpL-like. bbp2